MFPPDVPYVSCLLWTDRVNPVYPQTNLLHESKCRTIIVTAIEVLNIAAVLTSSRSGSATDIALCVDGPPEFALMCWG